MKICIATFAISMFCLEAHAANRVTSPADPAMQCTLGPSTRTIPEINQIEVDKGCITSEERDALNGFASVAVCWDVVRNGETFRVLAGWWAIDQNH